MNPIKKLILKYKIWRIKLEIRCYYEVAQENILNLQPQNLTLIYRMLRMLYYKRNKLLQKLKEL